MPIFPKQNPRPASDIWTLDDVYKQESGDNWPPLVANPAYRSLASYQTTSVNDTTPKTLPVPPNAVVGDLLLVSTVSYIFSTGPAAVLSNDSSWNKIICDWDNYGYESAVWWKVATSSDLDGSLTILKGNSTSATYGCGHVVAVSDPGSNPTVTSVVDTQTLQPSGTGNFNTGSAPTLVSGGIVLNFIFDRSGGNSYGTPSSYSNFRLRGEVSDSASGNIYTCPVYQITSDEMISGGHTLMVANLTARSGTFDKASIAVQIGG